MNSPGATPRGSSTSGAVCFTNARVFDGVSHELSAPTTVLTDDGKIAAIGKNVEVPAGARVIDAEGRTLTPGFIDAHCHLMLQPVVSDLLGTDAFYHAYRGAEIAKLYLSRGFTTVRDTGGNTFSLKRAIDEGRVEGPRIYPSGPIISQTSGHGDFTPMNEPCALVGGNRDQMQDIGHLLVVNGVQEMLVAARYVLGRGASQVKIAVGGGCASERDPLDVVEFTPDEIEAAVMAAANWNTYVATHVYNTTGIRRAVEAGVKTIEHANLIDEPTLALMKEKKVWLSPQVSVYVVDPHGFAPAQMEKFAQARDGLDEMFDLTKKLGFADIAFGTDIITNPQAIADIGDEFVHRTKWFTNGEVLAQATGNNGRMLALAGPRNPYPAPLGVIKEGAWADLLLIDGDPVADIQVLTDPEENLVVIMKDGKLVKDLISAG